MKESYKEGIASHFGPESCASDREDVGEALTGVHPGWVYSREIVFTSRCRRACHTWKATPTGTRPLRDVPRTDLARSETPCMGGTVSNGNREIPCLAAVKGTAVRIGKSQDIHR
jgi:RNA-directed DNA polymerase